MHLADAIGYGGSLGAQLIKDAFAADISRLDYFRNLSYLLSAAGAAGIGAAAFYFLEVKRHVRSNPPSRNDPGPVRAAGRLRELDRVVRLPSWDIAARWHGVYAKTPRQASFTAAPLPGVRVVTGVGGAGMTMSFGLAARGFEP